ncbi:MAG: hypothetical protein O2973_10960 [Gemmatimonadetes bacterium]|nr:hypothetical protein [Gemmatimonadota bacterium]
MNRRLIHPGLDRVHRARRIRTVRDLIGVAVGTLLLVVSSACADKEFTPPNGMRSPKISLQLTVAPPAQQATPAPRYLLVAALYEREASSAGGNGQSGD